MLMSSFFIQAYNKNDNYIDCSYILEIVDIFPMYAVFLDEDIKKEVSINFGISGVRSDFSRTDF